MYYIVITIVEHDTRKYYHEFIAGYYFKCKARVTIPKAMNERCFLGITFYYGNNDFILSDDLGSSTDLSWPKLTDLCTYMNSADHDHASLGIV